MIELQAVIWFGAMCALLGALGLAYLTGQQNARQVVIRVPDTIHLAVEGAHAVAGTVQLTNGKGITLSVAPGVVAMGPRQ